MAGKIKKLIFDLLGVNYEFESDSATPGPNSIGTDEIQDKSVHENDLAEEVTEKLDILDESNVITEEEIEEEWMRAIAKALGGGTQETDGGQND